MNKIKTLFLLTSILTPIYITHAETEKGLRIVRGIIDKNGKKVKGDGFTCKLYKKGYYDIFFDTPFSDTPALTAMPGYFNNDAGSWALCGYYLSPEKASIRVRTYNNDISEAQFSFIAIGPS